MVVRTRRRLDITITFPELQDLASFTGGDDELDGELVVLVGETLPPASPTAAP